MTPIIKKVQKAAKVKSYGKSSEEFGRVPPITAWRKLHSSVQKWITSDLDHEEDHMKQWPILNVKCVISAQLVAPSGFSVCLGYSIMLNNDNIGSNNGVFVTCLSV